MSTAGLLGCSALFVLVVPGLGWPLARRLALAPLETLGVSALFSLVLVYLFAGLVFIGHLPPAAFLALPLAAGVGLLVEARPAVALLRDLQVREAVGGWWLLAAWCLGAALFIIIPSGGMWAGDWWEHYERTCWFLRHGPPDVRFLEVYALPARPPLANLVVGGFLALTTVDFAHYQLFCVWLSSIVYLPLAMFAVRFGALRLAPLALACLLNASLIENVTFPWTKLPAAACILLGLYFVLRYRDQPALLPAVLAGIALAAGMLAHYSAGPYLVALGGWVLWENRRRLFASDVARRLAGGAAAFAGLFGTWLAWSWYHYGTAGTFASNSSTMPAAGGPAQFAWKTLVNLERSIVPDCLRGTTAFFEQGSVWAFARDCFFLNYQTNLVVGMGSAAGVLAVVLLWRQRQAATRGFWLAFLVTTIVLAAVVQNGASGGAHLCLQPLILLGVTLVAAHWDRFSPRLRLILAAGWLVDGLLGIALHFAVQNLAFDRWLRPQQTIFQWAETMHEAAQYNFGLKFIHRVDTLGDLRLQHGGVLLAFLLAVLALAAARTAAPRPPGPATAPLQP